MLAHPVRHPAGKGITCRNRLIAALPAHELHEVQRHVTTVPFVPEQTLHKRGDMVREVYFLAEGACSLLATSADGQGPEIAVIGNEGVIGANVFFGEAVAAADAVVSVGGGAVYMMSVKAFNDAMSQRGGFHNLIVRSSQAVIGQTLQLRSCNTFHSVEARACRWLLSVVDRVGTPTFVVPYSLLAKRLDVPLATVLRVVAALKRLGAIAYSGRSIQIVNRDIVLRQACDCYTITTAMYSRLLPELYPPMRG